MKWFRVYHELLYDRKIARIARTEQRSKCEVLGAWVGILVLASESPERGRLVLTEGVPMDVEEIGDALDMHGSDLTYLLGAFIDCHMLHEDKDGCMVVTNWDDRQFQSDNSTERVKRYRSRQPKETETAIRNGNETLPKRNSNVSETPSDTDTYTEPDADTDADFQRARRAARKAVPLPAYLATDDMMTAWDSWLDYHEEKGSPLTKATAMKQFTFFKEWGEPRSIAAIENSIGRGYVGLVEPKQTQGASNGVARKQQIEEALAREGLA